MTSIQREFSPQILHISKILIVLSNSKDVSSGGCFCVLFICHGSELLVTIINVRDMTHIRCDMTHGHVTWLIYQCDMTHTSVWHDSFVSVTWLIQQCDRTHTSVWHASYISVTWLIRQCDMTHSSVIRSYCQQVHGASGADATTSMENLGEQVYM